MITLTESFLPRSLSFRGGKILSDKKIPYSVGLTSALGSLGTLYGIYTSGDSVNPDANIYDKLHSGMNNTMNVDEVNNILKSQNVHGKFITDPLLYGITGAAAGHMVGNTIDSIKEKNDLMYRLGKKNRK